MSNKEPFKDLDFRRKSEPEMLTLACGFFEEMNRRRSVRQFSADPVPRELIELAIRSASTAPSGAHRQPWRFVAVCDPEMKKQIRIAAEEEEKKSYEGRMPKEWLKALEPIGTNCQKPFLETVPWLVIVFAESYGLEPDGVREKNYYVQESVGIACGLFIAAIHHMGLATLTHTPSPMGFLSELLERPKNERPYILFPDLPEYKDVKTVDLFAYGHTVPPVIGCRRQIFRKQGSDSYSINGLVATKTP